MTVKDPTTNLLLDTLVPQALVSLNIRAEHHPIGTVLLSPDQTPEFVYFPHRGAVVSIIRATVDGSTVEAGVIGSEGMFNLQTVIATSAPTGNQSLVQIEGTFSRIDARAIRSHFQENVGFRDRILEFTNLFIGQVTQNLVCNRLHPIEQRLAKWLLIVRDRTDTDGLNLTHDFLAHMLGIHRPGVSLAISSLTQTEVVAHSRGLVTVRDHAGLEALACECYRALEELLRSYRRTFPDSASPGDRHPPSASEPQSIVP